MITRLARYIFGDRILHHIHAPQPKLPTVGECDAVIRLGGNEAQRLPASHLAAALTASPLIYTQNLEPRPTSTPLEAKAIAIHSRGWSWKTIVLVTNRYHMARALWLFRGEMPGVRIIPYYADKVGDGQREVDGEARKWLGNWIEDIF